MKNFSLASILVFYLFHLSANGQNASPPWPVVTLGQGPARPIGMCEPSLSINRQNPQQMVAGAVLHHVYRSSDGGAHWQHDTLRSSHGVWGDPVLLSDYSGAFYYFHLSDPAGANWASTEILDRIVCQKSTDGGRSWNDGSYFGHNPPKDQDKHWVAVDPHSGKLHATWTQFDVYGSANPTHRSHILYASSTDGGHSWTAARVLSQISGNCLDGDSTAEGAVPAVGPDGEVYVAWARADSIYFNRSLNGGADWLARERAIAGQPGGWDIDIPGLKRANGMPVTVCDLSYGLHRGTVYVSWVDHRKGNYDVWVVKSTDQGTTWSQPQRINQDTGSGDQFFSWLTCDPYTGSLYSVFYDRRDHPDTRTEVYLAHSDNGGEDWGNVKISEQPFIPVDSVFFGDYNHIDAYQNIIRPVWTHYQNDSLAIKTSLITAPFGK